MFTVMFAIARTVGWVAHWQEMIADPAMKIGRPRQLYTGPTQRDYVDIDKRAEDALLQPSRRRPAAPRVPPHHAPHRSAVHRARRRLPDAVDGNTTASIG